MYDPNLTKIQLKTLNHKGLKKGVSNENNQPHDPGTNHKRPG